MAHRHSPSRPFSKAIDHGDFVTILLQRFQQFHQLLSSHTHGHIVRTAIWLGSSCPEYIHESPPDEDCDTTVPWLHEAQLYPHLVAGAHADSES
jgi:hypothetical protein